MVFFITYLKKMNKWLNIKQDHSINNKNYDFSNKIDMKDCIIISQRIKQENIKNWKHMIEKIPEEIYNQSKEVFCSKVSDGENIIWFINAMKVKHNWFEFLESWSIIVHPSYQKQGLWFLLKKDLLNLLEAYWDTPVFSVSNQLAVQKINQKLDQKTYTKEKLSKQILDVIESNWKLLDNDFVYINESLFNLLIQTKW